MKYMCPVCGYYSLSRPADDYNICPSCGTEFSVDDVEYTLDELRANWVRNGYQWHSRVIARPPDWNPIRQLERVLIPVAIQETETSFMVGISPTATIIPVVGVTQSYIGTRRVRVESHSAASTSQFIAVA